MNATVLSVPSSADTAGANAASWLNQLMENNVLRWQHGVSNIGLLLAPLLEVTGWKGDVLSLCDALPVDERRVEVIDLLTVMGYLGYRIHTERRNASDLQPEDMPGLFVPDTLSGWQRAVILREIGPYGMIWEDGREQHRGALSYDKGTLYRFSRATEETAEDVEVAETDWLKQVALRFRSVFWHAAVLSLVMHLFTLAMPLFSMAVYDRVIATHAVGTLPLLAVGVIGALAVEALIRWIRIQ